MIAALVWAGILFYAVLYSGVRAMQGWDISTIGALRGDAEVPRGQPPAGTMGSGIRGTEASGTCKDDYRMRRHAHPNGIVKLQPGAMRAFLDAERRKGGHILLTGSWRSCASQVANHAKDPSRFAAAGTSLHPKGLAIDIARATDPATRAALAGAGWKQSRPGDEPWHWSYGVAG